MGCCHGAVCEAVDPSIRALFGLKEYRVLVMGATLSCRAEWTSASDKGGKLDFSKSNETLLLEILKYVEDLCREHAREADVVFKRPFVWKTSLSLSNFEPLRRGDEYTFRFVVWVLCWVRFIWKNRSGSSIVSVAKEERGDSHLSVTEVAQNITHTTNTRLILFPSIRLEVG